MDAGDAWDTELDQSFKFNVGYGFGISLVTPFGPIRIDYALGSQGGRTHFSFGGKF